MRKPLRNRAALFLVFGIALSLAPSWAGRSYAQSDSVTFPETGKTVQGRFLEYWEANGGLPQQGYPISDELQERSDTDGMVYTMQYFERAVFEAHPENAAPNDVLLSLLGNFQYQQKYPEGAPNQEASTDNATHFHETGKTLGGRFREYWEANGGLRQQGYPISDEFEEVSALDGNTYIVQYFERAVFEWHPENEGPYDVLLSQLGTFQYRERYGGQPPQPPATATYTAEEVDYFVEVALGTEFHGSGATIAKWEQPIKVAMEGSPTEADRLTLAEVVNEINAIVGKPVMSLVEASDGPNMRVIFDAPSNFSSILPEYVPGNLGYFYFWFGEPQSIVRAVVLITTDGVTQQERSHLIREEVTQAMGLAKDSNKYPDSIFYQPWTDTTSYAEIDKQLIRMLHDAQVKPGMNEEQVRAIFGSNSALALPKWAGRLRVAA